jgi:hypothetical protein
MIWALKLLDVVLSELRSGEPDLDHVLCSGQRGNEATRQSMFRSRSGPWLHVPAPEWTGAT